MPTIIDGTNGVILSGSTSGTVTIQAPAVAGSPTITMPTTTGQALVSGTSLVLPQGRLTLVTATPVMTSNQTGKTTLYYTPYRGATIPIYDGSKWTHRVFSELSKIGRAHV